MSIKKTLEDFDKKFPENLGDLDVCESDWRRNDDIKQFITSEIEKALIEIVPEEKPMTGDDLSCRCDGSGKDPNGFCDCDFSRNDGYNACIEQIKSNISNYIK